MLPAILLVPAVATLLAWWQPRVLLVRVAAFVQLALVVAAWSFGARPLFGGYLALDAPGLLILSLTSLLFAGVSVYVGGYLERAEKRPLRVFIAALLGLQTAVTLVCCAQHFGLFWVAIETSTLASAPLLFFHHSGRAIAKKFLQQD